MSALKLTSLQHAAFGVPRFGWRRVLRWLAALDTLHRERADLAAFDEATLRDIGVTRAEVAGALRRSDEHLALILLRGGHKL